MPPSALARAGGHSEDVSWSSVCVCVCPLPRPWLLCILETPESGRKQGLRGVGTMGPVDGLGI